MTQNGKSKPPLCLRVSVRGTLRMHRKWLRFTAVLWASALMVWGLTGCGPSSGAGDAVREVVVYTSWDKPHARLVLAEFERQTGIEVRAVYDTEAAKTAGLVNRLIAEQDNPVADVFWNSELVQTWISNRGCRHKPPAWGALRPSGSDGYWTGWGALAACSLCRAGAEPSDLAGGAAGSAVAGTADHGDPLFGTATEVATWFSGLDTAAGAALSAGAVGKGENFVRQCDG